MANAIRTPHRTQHVLRSAALRACALMLAAALVGLTLLSNRQAQALPPAGTDMMPVVVTADVSSRLGTDTVVSTGYVQVSRQAPHMEGGVEVVDTEIVAMNLVGASSVGAVSTTERPNSGSSYISAGEIRNTGPSAQSPARSFFDVFADIVVPASPGGTQTFHNETPMRLTLTENGLDAASSSWPPKGGTYTLEPIYNVDNDGDGAIDEDTADDDGDGKVDEDRAGVDPATPGGGATCRFPPGSGPFVDQDCDGADGEDPPPAQCTPAVCDDDSDGQSDEDPSCIPLVNAGNSNNLKAGFCIRNLTLEVAPEWPSLSVARGGPLGRHPADILALSPSGAAAPPPPGPTPVSGNDAFANGYVIPVAPFTGTESTVGMTTESQEPVNPTPVGCPAGDIPMGATVWFRYTPPASGNLTVDTIGSSFDTVLAAYTGATINSLTNVACNDDVSGGLQSQVTFPVTAGTLYHIQVGGYNYPPVATGNLVLNVGGGSASNGSGQPPYVRIACDDLGLTADGCDSGADGDQDDLDALSYGSDFPAGQGSDLFFSVAPGAQGLPSSAVSEQASCPAPEPEGDIFGSSYNGSNYQELDGNGPIGACTGAFPKGLTESVAARDDQDAVDNQDPSAVDPDGDGVPTSPVYFSLDPTSPSLATLGTTAGAVLRTVNGATPTVFAAPAALGLEPTDDLDALCLKESGNGTLDGADTLYFSLAPGSPTLAQIGANPGDILAPSTPDATIVLQESALGLQAADDLDAMKCFAAVNQADVSALSIVGPSVRLATGQQVSLQVIERIANAGPSEASIGGQLDATENNPAISVRWISQDSDTCSNNGSTVACGSAQIDRLNTTVAGDVAEKQSIGRSLQITCNTTGTWSVAVSGAWTVTAPGGDPNPGNNSASTTIPVECTSSASSQADLRIDQFRAPRFLPLATGQSAVFLVDPIGFNAGPTGAYPGNISTTMNLRAFDPSGIGVRWFASGSDTCRNDGASAACAASEVDELTLTTPAVAGLPYLGERGLILTCEQTGVFRVPVSVTTVPASLSDPDLTNNVSARSVVVLCLPMTAADSDDDQLTNPVEIAHGLEAGNADTDGDTRNDGLDPEPSVPDYDSDGCSDGREAGTDQSTGGLRNAENPYDFFDAPLPAGPPGTGARDQRVTIGDIVGVVSKFGSFQGGGPLGNGQVYNPDFDRQSRGPAPNLGPGNGSITIDDIVSSVGQFGASCV